jgi:hypothetical protein
MSISDMKRYIAENVEKVQDPSKLEQMMEMIRAEKKKEISAKEIWAEIVSKHDGLMKRLAQ